MNGHAPLAIVIFKQQRIIHVDPGAPFVRASLAAHKDISSLTTKTKYPRGRSRASTDHSARKCRGIETETFSTSQADCTFQLGKSAVLAEGAPSCRCRNSLVRSLAS